MDVKVSRRLSQISLHKIFYFFLVMMIRVIIDKPNIIVG